MPALTLKGRNAAQNTSLSDQNNVSLQSSNSVGVSGSSSAAVAGPAHHGVAGGPSQHSNSASTLYQVKKHHHAH